jgi:hypothetical protein
MNLKGLAVCGQEYVNFTGKYTIAKLQKEIS